MMNLEDNGFDALREKLYDVQMPVDDSIWESIESSLRRRRIRKVIYWTSSVAAAILVAVLLVLPSSNDRMTSPAVVAEVQVEKSFEESAEVDGTSVNGSVAVVAGTVSAGNLIAQVTDVTDVADVVAGEVAAEAASETVAEVASEVASEVTSEVASSEVVSEAVAEEKREEKRADANNIGNKVYEREFEELWEESARDKKMAFALLTGVMPGSSASVMNSSIKSSQSGIGLNTPGDLVEQISDTKYSLPLNLGVQVQIPVKGSIALGIGINYTMISSKYDCLINKKKYGVKQTLHYVGIPVNIYGIVVERNNFSFYVNAGATVEKGINAVYKMQSYTGKERFTNPIDGIQLSVNAGLGVEYKFSSPAGIYFEPNLMYFFNSDVPRSIRTDQPLQVKGEIGLRFHF